MSHCAIAALHCVVVDDPSCSAARLRSGGSAGACCSVRIAAPSSRAARSFGKVGCSGSNADSVCGICHPLAIGISRSEEKWRKRNLAIRAAEQQGGGSGGAMVFSFRSIDHFFLLCFLQGFNWESQAKKPWYDTLKSRAAEIQAAGFTDVWFPPPSQSVDKHGYLPTQLYDLNSSSYGNEAQLRECIDVLHSHNLCCIADIVINHRSGWKQDSTGHWNLYEGGTKDKRLDWGPWALVSNDIYDSGGKGSKDSGESYGAAPDLDHSNKQVQDELTDWMNWMKAEIGFDGWRFDFVKGYSPAYTKIYCERTHPSFSVGEYWTSLNYENGRAAANQNTHRQQLCDWIDGTGGLSCVFDFTTKGVLQDAVKNEYWRLRDGEGKPPGLIGWYPTKAVTFVDNHDTGSTQRHWNFPDDKVLLGYVYIITHPGIPCIFWDHFFDWGMKDKISQLMELRRNNGIHSDSKITILAADFDMYVACVDERLIIKLGNRFDMGTLVPNPTAWKIIMTGPEFAIWENMKEHAILPQPKLTSDIVINAAGGSAADATKTDVEIKITTDMSCGTVGRIMQEVPGLVSNAKDLSDTLKSCKLPPPSGIDNGKNKDKDKDKSKPAAPKHKVEIHDEDNEDDEDDEDDDDDDEDDDEDEDDNENDDDDKDERENVKNKKK
ncbi:alpha-amylase [Selaginella moellendorffii]|uniref:alpha-amylase n=1 Tax=Selaginella moellendorffii TaxID=88036 RepID=UPI000D1CF15F|nr:alpha-amylase [Selaginella moellendorffii]|eukprot:XP_024541601.1 alpha-amylase [Selaginella moellendorffii]